MKVNILGTDYEIIRVDDGQDEYIGTNVEYAPYVQRGLENYQKQYKEWLKQNENNICIYSPKWN